MVKTKDKKPEVQDNSNLESAVADAADEMTGTTGVLDQPGPEIVMGPAEEELSEDEQIVVVEQKRIELSGMENLVTDQSGQVLIYGPFDEYRIVNSDFGDYAVTKGLVLGFQIRDWFNKKEQRMEK